MKDRNDREENAQHFLQLIRRSQRGVFKVYIGMIAGVGKTYRMGKFSIEVQKSEVVSGLIIYP